MLPLPDDVLATVSENWSGDWMGFGNVDGTQYGVPVKSDLKSLVWYIPSSFAEKGYEVPTTLDDFFALTEEMVANGDTPLCVGIESSAATGWPFTDWVEELILRNQGVDFYNQWVAHEIPFNSPEVVETFQQIVDLWNGEGMTYAAGGSIVVDELPGQRRAAGRRRLHDAPPGELLCACITAAGTPSSARRKVRSTRSTSRPTKGSPMLSGGIVPGGVPRRTRGVGRDAVPRLTGVRQRPPDGADRDQAGAALRLPLGQPQRRSEPCSTRSSRDSSRSSRPASPVAFDASDNMPAEVGTGTFWSEGTSLINGDIDAQEAADNIEASWPTS